MGKMDKGIKRKLLPEKIYFGLQFLNKGKFNCELVRYKYNNEFVIEYRSIKSGGLIATLQAKDIKEVKAERKLYNILVKQGVK